MVMLNDRCFTKSDRRIGDLHFAVKDISDEAFEYVLKVAQSFSLDDSSPGKRLVHHTRLLIESDGTAKLKMFWSFDGTPFVSDVYTRDQNGRWTSDVSIVSPVWSARIEGKYLEKLREISAAVKLEAN